MSINFQISVSAIWDFQLPVIAAKRTSPKSKIANLHDFKKRGHPLQGVYNGLHQFKSVRKICPLLELLAKIRGVLAENFLQLLRCWDLR